MECPKWLSWVVLLVGLIMLGQDLNLWSFWSVGAWSTIFVVLGLCWVLPRN